MADTLTETRTLKVETYYVDGDTRVITLKNPKNNITTQEIINLQTMLQTKQVLIGDRNGAAFGKIPKVTKITETRANLDIS